VWFLVSGEEKASAVAQALAPGTDLHDIPAVGVTGELETIWFLDRESASKL
jgi:6-phosphogluconolactonase